MEARYHVTGAQRKELVEAVSGIVGIKAVYMRVPTCAYAIGNLVVSREGTLIWDDSTDSGTLENILEGLAQAGFTAEEITQAKSEENTRPGLQDAAAVETAPETAQDAHTDGSEEQVENNAEEKEKTPQGLDTGLTVALPRETFTDAALENLHKLVEAKGSLIRKALAVDSLPIKIDGDKVSFPWFPEGQDVDAVKACTHFITALCDMARNQKRVTAKEKPADNEKYAFRCFLLRLGFIGAEYKEERKSLLKNLSGNSSFKSGGRKEAADGEVSE